MKLFLASYIRNPQTWSDMEDFVDGLNGKRIAYIPTASNGEFDYGSWRDSETYRQLLTTKAKVTPIELEAYKTPSQDISRDLQDFDLLWVAGGMAGYLMYWIRRTQLDKHLPRLLNQNLTYIGSSAGSVVAGTSLQSCEWYMSDSEFGAGIFPGLSLVDFSIYPHYRDELKDEVESKWSSGRLILLKDGESVTMMEGVISVLGTGESISK